MLNATPIFRLWAHRRLAALSRANPAELQERQLMRLLRAGRDTRFGRDHGFKTIRGIREYQKRVPLRRYEQFWDQYWRPAFPTLDNCTWPGRIPFFPVSSGTSSGTTKYIPCTREMVNSNNKAGTDLLAYHVTQNPKSNLLGGRSFMLGGSTELLPQAPGVQSGDLSGISVITLPWWAKARYFPPPELALLKDWENKIDRFATESVTKDIRMLGGVPSWLLVFIQRLRDVHGKPHGRLVDFFPNLELLAHGGVNFAPYHEQFVQLLEGSHAELREVYPASEGFIAVADRGYHEGLRLTLDTGIFHEFVPFEELDSPNPTRHWVGNIEPGVNYAVVLTTCAGLWSYILGDTVRFVDCKVPRLLVTGRTSYYLSAFGEHVIAEEVEDAVTVAAGAISSRVTDFLVGPRYPAAPGELGGHIYFVEFDTGGIGPESLKTFAERVDSRLQARNEDYQGHRAEGFGLAGPTIHALQPGTFKEWMRSRGKLGGQNKVPRLTMKTELLEDLSRFCASHSRVSATANMP